jgi:hypothetical protein
VSDTRRSSWLIGLAGASVFAVALAAVAWFVWHPAAGDREHDRALARWESRAPAAYSFDWSYCGGMCALCRVRVTVEDGHVTGAVGVEGQCSYELDRAPTIDDVFAMEKADRSAANTDSFEIRYDPTWGFPATVTIRCPPGWMDCGTGYSVTNFQARTDSPSPAR